MKKSIKVTRKPLITSLEPRLLLDGAAVATAVDTLSDMQLQQDDSHQALGLSGNPQEKDTSKALVDERVVETSIDEAIITEVVIVDWAVEDYATLVADIDPSIPVIVLEQGKGTLKGIAEALSDYESLSAVHLVTHGSVGQLTLGDEVVNLDTLDASIASLAGISDAMAENADLMIYGCTVAGGDKGEAFVEGLADALGDVDIAASDDRTGPAELGGDWDLEWSSGAIETVQGPSRAT